jgi:hypothetical protein
MDLFLMITLMLTMIVFGVDASQKRRQYLNEQAS